MNKRKLQEFASWAKQNLEKQIELSLKKIGINSETDIKKSRVQGDITIVDGVETTFKKQFHHQREEIINRIKDDGYNHTIEQFASTWFNRIIALRFLEVHDYLDHGFKLFPKEPNTLPEILSKLPLVRNDLKLDMKYIEELTSSGNNNEELYRYILFQQCNTLGKALPMLFSSGMSYLEHFIPTPLLFGDTIINKLIEINEEDFREDVEIIGWLYQFYVSFLREETRSKKKTEQNDIPILSQVFTPDWIVKYMAENSIGRIWLESYPSSAFKSEMKYYVDEAKQEPDVEEKLESIRYRNVNPEEIKIIEPCSGSGHILVYCFDLLLHMYQEKGYSKKDIPSLILKNNLVGLDIDQRATQLASFALVMRARSIDNKFFDEGRYVRPKVYEIIDSKALAKCDYSGKSYKEIINEYNSKQWNGENQLTVDELKAIEYLVDLFDDAKIIGSLLKVNPGKYLTIRKKLITNLKEKTQVDIFTSAFFDYEFKDLLEILRVAYFMVQKYDVMITNPPYIGISTLDINPKDYLSKNYTNSKSDMFAMFMETPLVKKNGLRALVNPDSWMFLKSFEQLRLNLLSNEHFINMTHHGMGEFDAVVQTTSFVIRNYGLPEFNGTYYRLVNSKNKVQDFLSKVDGIEFVANGKKFLKIPGYIFAYWGDDSVIQVFNNPDYESFVLFRQGMATSDNDRFIRLWHEVSKVNISFNSIDLVSAKNSRMKWFPYNKGGEVRKWYGNHYYLVNWLNDGEEMKEFTSALNQGMNVRLKSREYYFKETISWSKISSKSISFRYYPAGFIFDVAGCCVFESKIDVFYLLGLSNSFITTLVMDLISPTLNFELDHLKKLPIIYSPSAEKSIIELVKNSIETSKEIWDSYETSWLFSHQHYYGHQTIKNAVTWYLKKQKENTHQIINNEEKINHIFSQIYRIPYNTTNRTTESYPVFINDIQSYVVSLISLLIGFLMGRYSLVEDGLIFAGGTFDPSRYGNHDVDSDGIIPIYSDISIKDGLVHRITGLVKDIYGIENYRENISFIAEALGKKSNETSEETLNRYLNEGFYQDHLKTYQKRPIYWMFSSGKSSGFKCLIYMHRYNQDTLAKINAGYFQPATTILRNQITEIERQISIAVDTNKRLLEKKRLSLIEQLNEAREYGQVLDYMANKYISIDLDDGVKVNYTKFQGIEVTTNGGKVKKDLLIPIK